MPGPYRLDPRMPIMSYPYTAMMSAPNFQYILDAALDSYAKQTGIDLTKHPSADELQDCRSPDDVLQILSERESAFEDYRDQYRNLIGRVRPVVQVVHALSGVLGEIAGLVPFQPTKAIFVSVDVLLSAASGVSASYDALTDLFECVSNFLRRFQIYVEKVSFSPAMSNIVVKIIVEVLTVLALATKQINQGRFKKFAKKLFGESDVEAVLQRLDRLTQEEARVTSAHTLEVVHGLFDTLRVVMEDGEVMNDGIRKALLMIQETTDRVNKLDRNQFQENVRRWLSPPDPSTNHNIALRKHLKGTTLWFTQSVTLKGWKETGSLLWIHGKPGSGKTILCSGIIQEIEGLRDMGLAHMTYFYCDFRDSKKQQVAGLLASLLAQLSAKSDPCYEILSALYSKCDAGSRQPSDDELMGCLEDMLNLEGQPPTFIVIDGLDECPGDSVQEYPRERVLEQVEKLVALQLPNIRICVTSRPEADIQDALTSLASHAISLHDEQGQKRDIADYVRNFVHSDRKIRKWREEDKNLVVETLTRKADGMFHWIVCQLEALRRCFPSGIRLALDELPMSLDETYDRILLGISRERQEHAQRLFLCLAESIRPLHAEELAEILAIRFNPGELPHYNMDWRLPNPEEAVLSACSSLITIVDVGTSRVVQFSHFSVKEYLSSKRLARAGNHLSQYHIRPHFAHTILAQSSLSVLLAIDEQIDKERMINFPFAIYAAQYWVDHAQFDGVCSSIEVSQAMEQLFDRAKPHFSTWVWIYDIDHKFREILCEAHPTPPHAVPLYYAALCGFHDLIKHLLITYPEDVNADGGVHFTPLHAAVVNGNVDVMVLLLEHGADVAAFKANKATPLHEASYRGRLDMIPRLVEHNADVNAQDIQGSTPLFGTLFGGNLEIVRELLLHGAGVDISTQNGSTPLLLASQHGHLDIVRLLLQSGAALDLPNNQGWTPLMLASENGQLDVVHLLLQNGASLDSRNVHDSTPLMFASQGGYPEIVQLFLTSGASVNSRSVHGWSPLICASQGGYPEIVQLLLTSGASVDSRCNGGWTALMYASRFGRPDVVHLLLQSSAAVDLPDNQGWTPLISASENGQLDVVRLLLQNGASLDSRNVHGSTPLMSASQGGYPEIVRLLLTSGASVDSRGNGGWTALMCASRFGHADVVRLLIQSGASVCSSPNDNLSPSSDSSPVYKESDTPLHLASTIGHLVVAELLIQCDADVNSQNHNLETPLDLASAHGQLEIVRLLLTSGSSVNSQDAEESTPLHRAAQSGHLDIVTLLFGSGADANIRDMNDKTALDLALDSGRLDVAMFLSERMGGADSSSLDRINLASLGRESQNSPPDVARASLGCGDGPNTHDETTSLCAASGMGDLVVMQSLLENGADVNERDEAYATPLVCASAGGKLEAAKFLIERGADVNSPNWIGCTPLHAASGSGHTDVVHFLLDHGADLDAKDQNQCTALHLALAGYFFESVKALLKRGANIHVQNDLHETPFQMALWRKDPDLMGLFSEYGAHGK